MKTMRKIAGPLMLLLCLAPVAYSQPRLWGHLHSGQYHVGFRTQSEKAIDGELHIWYPAVANNSAKMTLADYLRLSHDLVGAVPGPAQDPAILRKTLSGAVTGKDDLLGPDAADRVLALSGEAVRNARPLPGKFPLVFWTHRYAVTSAQSVLNEYLASHGFVVVFAPENMPPVMPFALKSDEDRAKEFSRLTARLTKALASAKKLTNVQPGKVAVIGWSYAGEAAFALQQADNDVKLVIGFTTNVLDRWVYRPQQLASLKPTQLTAPYLLIDGGANTRPSIMVDAASRTFFIHMKDMAHGSFNVLEGMVPSLMGITAVQPWSKAGPQQQLGYEVAIQYVRRACEHYLKAIPTLDTPFTLWGPAGDVPEDFVTVEQGGTAPPAPVQPRFSTVEFPSLDQLVVTADLYSSGNKQAPTIVLVHQSGASRGEYRQIAPHLQQLGFNALAIDSRWGDRDRWNGVPNETAARAGTVAIVASKDTSKMRATQEAAAQDVRAALQWLRASGYSGPMLLWGSSISANLVLKVAAAPENNVAAVLSFSPGEYHKDQPDEMKSAVAALNIPTLIACAEDEEETSKPIFEAVSSQKKVFFHAQVGKHAASILLDEPENWAGITPFLKQFIGSRSRR